MFNFFINLFGVEGAWQDLKFKYNNCENENVKRHMWQCLVAFHWGVMLKDDCEFPEKL